MKKFILIAIMITGCSNVQHNVEEEINTIEADSDKVCKYVYRPRHVLMQCRPRTASSQ